LGFLKPVRVLAQPLHDLFVLDLINQLRRRLFIRSVEYKNRLVPHPAVGGRHRLASASQFLDLRDNPAIVIARQLRRREFNDGQT
jgi:hypothetical protein